VLADNYRLSVFENSVTGIRCELKAEEMGGNGCIMWSFMICSAWKILGLSKNSGSMACMGEERILNRILNA
jgi:hypothetical protein